MRRIQKKAGMEDAMKEEMEKKISAFGGIKTHMDSP